MDSDLIKLVNKLQDTFANLGEAPRDLVYLESSLTAGRFERW